MRKHSTYLKYLGFTLAELLVVMAVIGIIFAAVLPALTHITGPSKLDAAANAVHTAVKLARQYAVTRNQPAYLIFHNSQTNPDLAYRSYAVFTIDIHTETRPVPQKAGYFLTGWKKLPNGVVFDSVTSFGKNNVFILSRSAWSGGFGRHRRLKIDKEEYTVLGFKPQGVLHRNQDNDIHLTAGHYLSGLLKRTGRQARLIRVDSMGYSRISTMIYDENSRLKEAGP